MSHSFIQRLENVQAILDLSDRDVKEASEQAKMNLGLEDIHTLKSNIAALEKEGRKLRIGIVGRVKAGKSSLLNALLFDGEDILPKAATPMTAALTIMEYSEDVRAEVDFFSEADCQDVAEQAKRYEQELQQLIQYKLEELKSNKRLDEVARKERAERVAHREMKDSPLFAAYDQQQRMNKSDLPADEVRLLGNLEAQDLSELMKKLQDYVGAEGKYMPFTKSVRIFMPLESLKGLEIIDTPGINDPITSRGKRTEDMLASCDVILLVSPAGQFLNSSDLDLLSSITLSKGIKEAYLIASQVDNQVVSLSSESPTLNEAMSFISQELLKQAQSTFSLAKEDQPLMESIYECFTKHDVICTSGIAYALWKRFNEKATWDENMHHVYENNLSRNYSAEFSSESAALASLKSLANIEKVEKIVSDATLRKEEIQQGKIQHFLTGQQEAFEIYKQKWLENVEQLIQELKCVDIVQLETQQQSLDSDKSRIRSNVHQTYTTLSNEIEQKLTQGLGDILRKETARFRPDQARGTETHSEAYEESYLVKVRDRSVLNKITFGLLGDDEIYEKHYRTRYRDVTVKVVYATQLRTEIVNIVEDIGGKLNTFATQELRQWQHQVKKDLVESFKTSTQEWEFDIMMLDRSIQQVIHKIPLVNFSIDTSLPSSIDKSGTLQGWEGDRFIEEARQYIQSLESNVATQVKSYISTLNSSLQGIDVSKEIIQSIERSLHDLVEKIADFQSTLTRLESSQAQISAL